MSYKGQSFSIAVLEEQKLLYMYLSNQNNVVDFYNKFGYAVNSRTKLEDLDKIFKVKENPEGKIAYYADQPTIEFQVKDLETGKVCDFELSYFHSKTELPYDFGENPTAEDPTGMKIYIVKD